MGYYEESWNELPKKIPYDAFLQLISVITRAVTYLWQNQQKQEKISTFVRGRYSNEYNIPTDLHIFHMKFEKGLLSEILYFIQQNKTQVFLKRLRGKYCYYTNNRFLTIVVNSFWNR